jgi:N-sulfoglucosamine sulfohydrolase
MVKPNIVYIHSHDTGRYVQPYGYAVPTPHIQKLAEQGVLFRQAFSVAPTCSPSRAGLLTGQCAHSAGMLGLAHRGFSMNDYSQHLVHTLRRAGYYSALAGVQHIAADPTAIGYDETMRTEWKPTVDRVVPAAVDWLSGRPAEPFFLSVGFFETHREYPELGPDDDPRYVLPPPPLPDTADTRRDMATFVASARILDRGVGALLEALEVSGYAQNTLVICTTDHGIAFPGMKCTLTDRGIGVMLIVRGPGGFQGGRVCDALVSHIDIYPTICDLLEIDAPGWLQGQSIMPLFRGQTAQIRDAVYAEVTFHAAYEPKRAVRTQRWKYIRRFDGRETAVLPNCDDSYSKSLWLQSGWADRQVDDERLYDLVFDPNEVSNLAWSPTHAEIVQDMRSRLDRWMHSTDDPLLYGPVLPPSGVELNSVDGVSPQEPTSVVQ